MSVSVPCGICPTDIGEGAATCPGCGRPVDDRDHDVLQVRREASGFAAHERAKRVRNGSKWIGVLAILFAISAPILFGMRTLANQKGLEHLQTFDDDAVLKPINGKVYTAGELRKKIQREPYFDLVATLMLSGLMGALWAWGRRAPLPAIACALALFIVVQVVGALYDPTSIFKGILVKLFAFAALAKGLRAALAARAAMRAPAS